MRAPYRNRFDPTREFLVRKPTTVSGRSFERLERFDKTLVSERRLRQMFAQRTLVYDGESTPGGQLSAEEAAKTHRGAHAARVKAAAERRAKHAAEKRAKEAAAKGETADKAAKTPRTRKPKADPAPKPPRETIVGEQEVRVARASVDIPADWAKLPWPQRLQLAAQLTDDKVKNGADAAAAIEAELKRRGTS